MTEIGAGALWVALTLALWGAGAAAVGARTGREIAGHARDRYVYANEAGIFRIKYRIGDRVVAGQVVAQIGQTVLAAPLDGVLRGLTRDGVPVVASTKVIEVDPRGQPDLVRGIGERQLRIAVGVVRAIEHTATDASEIT